MISSSFARTDWERSAQLFTGAIALVVVTSDCLLVTFACCFDDSILSYSDLSVSRILARFFVARGLGISTVFSSCWFFCRRYSGME